MDVLSREAGPEPPSFMLETDAGTVESEADFTDTAEPAAAEVIETERGGGNGKTEKGREEK